MVNDLIIQKNNLNLNLDPIYVDTKVIRAKKASKVTKPVEIATINNIISSPSSSPSTTNTIRPTSTITGATGTTTKTLTSQSIVTTNSIKSSSNNKILLNDEKILNKLQQKTSHSTIGYQNQDIKISSFNLLDNINSFDNNIQQQEQDHQLSENHEEDEQISPILPPPPILKLSSSKFLNKSKSNTLKTSKIISNLNTDHHNSIINIASPSNIPEISKSDLVTLTKNNSVSGETSLNANSSIILKIKKKFNNIEKINDDDDDVNYDDNNGLKIDDGEIIANNLNWKFFDRISLLDDELRDQESSGENNFDDCNGATTSSQEVLLSKSNQLQKNSTTQQHYHNSEEDHPYIYSTQTLDSYNTTIITNPHKKHQNNRDHKLNTTLKITTSTTTATSTSIAYVVSDMNSPESPSTSAAVVINNNYTNTNYQNNNNTNNNNNHHSISKNHNKKNNSNNINNNTIISTSISPNCSSIINNKTITNKSGGSIGNLRNDTMIGSNITTSENSQNQHQGILGQQQQSAQTNNNSSSLKRKSNKKTTGSISGGIGVSAGVGGGNNNVGSTASGILHNNKKNHSVFNGLPDNGIGFHLGLYGWRKKCLYILLLILMLLIIVNLILTLWILKVMEFSSEGMGQLKIVPGGIQLSGQALIMDLLRASVIRSKHGQPITLESSRNFSINTRDSNGILENHLFLGHDKLECLANGFRINDTTGKNLFSVNRNEVIIGAHHLRIDGEGGVTFRESVQTPHVRAEPSRELRLESPTRQLEMTAAKDINLQSRAGGIDINALDDVKLSSIDGSIRLESSKIFLPNLKPVKLLTSGSTSFHENFDKVTQLCACSNGKLFLASPKGHCSDDEGTICR